MKQYNFTNNTLTLKVKKSPIFVRSVMFLLSFLFFIAPLVGVALAISFGGKFHIGFIFMMLFFGLLGFYLLRVSLWNTYGEEVIIFNKTTIIYEANYGWFKDGKRNINVNHLKYTMKSVGYEEDEKGVLIIGNEDDTINSVVQIPVSQLKELIDILLTI